MRDELRRAWLTGASAATPEEIRAAVLEARMQNAMAVERDDAVDAVSAVDKMWGTNGLAHPGVHAFAGKRVLITGARGFLGQNFVRLFREANRGLLKNKPVHLLLLDSGITASIAEDAGDEHVTWVCHDVSRAYHPDDHVDFILHLAGIASPKWYRKFPLQTLDVAVWGTRHMLGIARAHGARMVFFSSSEIYGDPPADMVPTPESYVGHVSSLGPRAVYDESKRLGETLVSVYASSYKVQASIVRPFNVYGPGMSRTDGRVLSNFVQAAIRGEPLTIYAGGDETRTYCYVSDFVAGAVGILLHGAPGEPYNVGNDKPEIDVAALARLVVVKAGGAAPIHNGDAPELYPVEQPRRRCPDLRKVRHGLGYTPQVALEAGLERFIRWAREAYADALPRVA